MHQPLPTATPSQDSPLELAQLSNFETRMEFDLESFSLPESPYTLTSSLLALSPLSAFDIDDVFDPEALADSDLDANPPLSPPRPPAVQIHPFPLFCNTCGSSVVSPLPSTVTLYSLAITMPHQPANSRQTRSSTTNTPGSEPPPTIPSTRPATRGQKRKAPAADVPENVPAAADPPSAQPQPTIPTTAAKSKPKTNAKAKRNTTVPNATAPATASTAAPVVPPLAAAPVVPPLAAAPAPAAAPALAVAPATAITPIVPTPAVLQNLPDDSDMMLSQPINAPDLNQDAELAGTLISNALAANPAQQQGGTTGRSVESLVKENQTLKKFKAAYIKLAQEKNTTAAEGSSSSSQPENSIPRPPGERGKNGWNMQTALRLAHDGDTYNAILATTRSAIQQSGLDWKMKFDEQDPARVGVCYSQMKHVHPYLKQFKNDWACRELVLGALQNRRKTEHAKIKALMTNKKADRPHSKRAGFKARPKGNAKESESEAAHTEGSPDQEENYE